MPERVVASNFGDLKSFIAGKCNSLEGGCQLLVGAGIVLFEMGVSLSKTAYGFIQRLRLLPAPRHNPMH